MKVPDLFVGKRLFVGLGLPEIFGRGQKEVRGSAFIQGPEIVGDPEEFNSPNPQELGSLMVNQTGNKEMKPTPFYALIVKSYMRVMEWMKIDTQLTVKTIKAKVIFTEVVMAKTKNFVIDHPTKEGKQLVHACLEGPENAVYVRGRLASEDRIILPDYWVKLVRPETITVSITPIGHQQNIIVKLIGPKEITLQSDSPLPISCFYHVFAERKDVRKLRTEIDKK
jgi:hypothetical protein